MRLLRPCDGYWQAEPRNTIGSISVTKRPRRALAFIGQGLALGHKCTIVAAPSLIPKKPFRRRTNAPRRPAVAPTRFGSPLVLSRVHWVRPELVAEVKYLTWTEDNLLRQVVYEGLREDKPAAEVRRAVPYPKPAEPARPARPVKTAPVRLTGGGALPAGLYFTAGHTIAHSERSGRGCAFSRSVRPDHTPSLCQRRCPHRAAAMLFSPFSPDLSAPAAVRCRPFPDEDDSR